jgi:hypothetical protein
VPHWDAIPPMDFREPSEPVRNSLLLNWTTLRNFIELIDKLCFNDSKSNIWSIAARLGCPF